MDDPHPPLAGAGPAPPEESRALTGLRGLGALLVMLHHFYLYHHVQTRAPALGGLLQNGFMGVDLFFVLSGFVMSMVYGGWFVGSSPRLGRLGLGRPGRGRLWPVFLVRRIARLWPLHAAVLAILLAVGGVFGTSAGSVRLVEANFAMIQSWGMTASINPPSWSVSTELLAYLVFPLVAETILRSRFGPALGLLCVASMLTVCIIFAPPLGPARRGLLDVYQNYSLLPSLRCLAGFVIGMLAWRAGRLPGVQRWSRTGWTGPAALALFLAALMSEQGGVLGYALLPLIVLGMHYGTGAVCRAFATGPIHRLGVLSYAIYLIHYALLEGFPLGWAPLWAALAMYLVVTFGLAILAHAMIEVPGRLLLRRAGEFLVGRLLRPGRVIS